MKKIIRNLIFFPLYLRRNKKPYLKTKYRVIISKLLYKFNVGKKLNLDNPKDLNEKIQWLKLFSDTTLWPDLADKYKVRSYIKSCGLSDILNELYAVFKTPEDIDLSNLPNQVVLKLNNGSGTIMIIKDKNVESLDEIKKVFHKWYKEPFGLYSDEMHYLYITPCIIAEKLLINSNNDVSSSIIDYKFFCINSEPHCIMVCFDRKIKGHADKVIYDLNWNYRPDLMRKKIKDPLIPKPVSLEKMITISKILSKPFKFVRVDLYEVNGKPIFGEMTFTPMAGWSKVMTQELLNELGSLIQIN